MKKQTIYELIFKDCFRAMYYKNGDGEMHSYNNITISLKKTSTVKFLNDSILYGIKKGFEEFNLVIKDDRAFSNICAPVAALIQYYSNEKKIKFNVISSDYDGYIKHTHINAPLVVNEYTEKGEIHNPFDKVWVFSSDTEINTLVNNFLLYIRQADIIEDGVIGSIEWCINEVMDNVLQHSDIGKGYIMGQIHTNSKRISFCIFDYGIGIYNSLRNSVYHHPVSPFDAITMALQEKVTRDTNVGQGNGLWGLSRLITQSNGSLKVSSGGATFFNYNGQESHINEGDFNLGKSRGTTTVDFQLDYSKKIDISAALTGYNYEKIDLWLENLESDNNENVVNIKVLDMSNGTGTRKSAGKLRNMILNIINNDKKRIVLDFAGINTISSSFADELIGKMIKDKGFVFFTQVISLINITPLVTAIINRSVEQRMAQMYYDSDMVIK